MPISQSINSIAVIIISKPIPHHNISILFISIIFISITRAGTNCSLYVLENLLKDNSLYYCRYRDPQTVMASSTDLARYIQLVNADIDRFKELLNALDKELVTPSKFKDTYENAFEKYAELKRRLQYQELGGFYNTCLKITRKYCDVLQGGLITLDQIDAITRFINEYKRVRAKLNRVRNAL